MATVDMPLRGGRLADYWALAQISRGSTSLTTCANTFNRFDRPKAMSSAKGNIQRSAAQAP